MVGDMKYYTSPVHPSSARCLLHGVHGVHAVQTVPRQGPKEEPAAATKRAAKVAASAPKLERRREMGSKISEVNRLAKDVEIDDW